MKSDVITISTKGQIVLPVEIRRSLNLQAGDHLAVYATDDAIVLKRLDLPTNVEFEDWLDAVRPAMQKNEALFAEHDHA
ncbi:MAG: AbrB/MazE/SpoVT family DNA-binding domain-containing protein [Coriobacteriales bacterium]|nr:AbrB/MazE/SpoVT family DNA-binding domain-containing protein [Coriobacteriales bacterium]